MVVKCELCGNKWSCCCCLLENGLIGWCEEYNYKARKASMLTEPVSKASRGGALEPPCFIVIGGQVGREEVVGGRVRRRPASGTSKRGGPRREGDRGCRSRGGSSEENRHCEMPTLSIAVVQGCWRQKEAELVATVFIVLDSLLRIRSCTIFDFVCRSVRFNLHPILCAFSRERLWKYITTLDFYACSFWVVQIRSFRMVCTLRMHTLLFDLPILNICVAVTSDVCNTEISNL